MILDDLLFALGSSGNGARHWPHYPAGVPTKSGTIVTEQTAMTLPAVFCAVDLLASTMASLPVHAFQRVGPKQSEPRPDHIAERLLNAEPNAEQGAMAHLRAIELHRKLWGNGLDQVERNSFAGPESLRLLLPTSTTTKYTDAGAVYYSERQVDGSEIVYAPEDVVHVSGLSYDGTVGIGLIKQMARDNIGLGLAIAHYAEEFFGNSMMLGNVLSVPESMSIDARKAMEAELQKRKNFSWLVVDAGMDLKRGTTDNKAAQTIEQMTFNVQDIARWTRVPPPFLMELSRGTFSNIKELALWLVKFTLTPDVRHYEQEFGRKLFTAQERADGFYLKYSVDGLLRGDYVTRQEGHRLALQEGIRNLDEVRDLEGLNPLPDGLGQKHRYPYNSGFIGEEKDESASTAGTVSPEPKAKGGDESVPASMVASDDAVYRDRRERLKKTHARLIADAASRVIHKEIMAATRAAKTHAGDTDGFHLWTADFYNKHLSYVSDAFEAPVLSLAELASESGGLSPRLLSVADTLIKVYAMEHISQSVAELHDAFAGGAVEFCCEQWEINRPAAIAVQLTDQTVSLTFEEPVQHVE